MLLSFVHQLMKKQLKKKQVSKSVKYWSSKVHNFFAFCFWELLANSENIYKEFRSSLESALNKMGHHWLFLSLYKKVCTMMSTTNIIVAVSITGHKWRRLHSFVKPQNLYSTYFWYNILSCFLYIIYTTSACLLVIIVCVYDFLVSSLENKRCNIIEGQHGCTII